MKRNERKEKEFHSLQRCYDILSQTQNRYKIKEYRDCDDDDDLT